MNKLVSVVMSTKDTEDEMLKMSIESILKQSYSDFEFLIVCDGSEHDYEILKEYKDPRITIIKHEKSLGLTKSLNEAMSIAKGDYIARMDSDDISLIDRFAIQVQFMEKNRDVDICSTMTKNFGNSKKFSVNLYNDSEGIKSQLFLYNCLAHPSIMMRKEFILKNNIQYDENFKYSQDYELWSRCSKIGNLCVINKVGLLYRTHYNQISTSKLEEQNALCKYIYSRNLEELEFRNCDYYARQLLYLSGRSKEYFSTESLKQLINEILKRNLSLKIYNQKKLTKVLNSKLLSTLLKNNNYTIFIKEFFLKNMTLVAIKKVLITVKYQVSWIFRKKYVPQVRDC